MNLVSLKQLLISCAAVALATSAMPIAQAAPAAAPATAPATAPTKQGGSISIFLPLAMRSYPTATILGVGMNNVNESEGLSKLVDAGSEWTRTPGVIWSDVEKVEGTYDWTASSIASLDASLIAAKQNGIKVVLLVTRTPPWAQMVKTNAPNCSPIAQAKFGAFAKFMQQVVTRYSQTPYSVEYFEVWNEPDAPISTSDISYGCWGDKADTYFGGTYFGNMLAAVYPAMKQANPNIKVVLSGLLMGCDGSSACGNNVNTSRFFEGIMRSTGKNSFDVANFHGYDFYNIDLGLGKYVNPGWNYTNLDGPIVVAKARFLKARMAQFGVSKPLMNSETALAMFGCNGIPFQSFETTKAYYVPVSYAAAMSEGLIANIWFDAYGGWECTQLMDPAHPKALVALKVAHQRLVGAQFTREVTGLPSGIRAYEVNRGDKIVWVIWSLDGTPRNVTPALGTPAGVYGTDGRSITPTATISIRMEPYYLEFNP